MNCWSSSAPASSAAAGCIGYYPLDSPESTTPSRPTTTSTSTNKYLISHVHTRLAQRFDILQLLLVLPQLLRNDQLHLHRVTIMLVLRTLAVTSTLTTKLDLLRLLPITTPRPTSNNIYFDWLLLLLLLFSFLIGLILYRSFSMAILFSFSALSLSSLSLFSFSSGSSSASISPSSSLSGGFGLGGDPGWAVTYTLAVFYVFLFSY